MIESRNTSWPSSTTKARHDNRLLEANRVASEIRERWREGGQPDVGAALAEHPELQCHRSVVIGLAYEEYRRRLDAGEAWDAEQFSQRFPVFQKSIRRLINAHALLDGDPRFQSLENLSAWPEPGEFFLGFHLVAELGRGSFGRVFLANEPALGDRDVVVKVTSHGGREAHILGRLRHPNIVPIHSVQEDPPTRLTAFCMPYLGRATLADVLDRALAGGDPPKRASAILDAVRAVHDDGELSDAAVPDRIVRGGTYVEGIAHLGAQLADALAHAHSRGICHRDLKPSNVLLSFEGHPLLLDFNLSVDGGLAISKFGGTLPYMAPEQLALASEPDTADRRWPYDPRSDLFSLGVMLYELLAGVLPFGSIPAGRTIEELAAALRQRQLQGPRPLEERLGQIERRLARVVESCLAFDPEQRPQTADHLAAQLRRELSPPRRARRWVRANRRPLAAIGAAILAIVLGAAAALAMRPPYSVRQFHQGLDYAQRADYATAEACFSEALRSDPQNGEILIARADALNKQGDFRMAFEDYRTAYELAADPGIAARMGYCLSRLGQHEIAVAYYRNALEAGYSSPGLLNNIGRGLLMRSRTQESEKYLRQAIQQDPNLAPAYHNLVVVFLRRALEGQSLSEEAVECARRAADLGPPSVDLYRDVAALLALAARRDGTLVKQSVAYLDQAVACGLDPRKAAKDPVFAVLHRDIAFQELSTKKPSLPSPLRGDYLAEP